MLNVMRLNGIKYISLNRIYLSKTSFIIDLLQIIIYFQFIILNLILILCLSYDYYFLKFFFIIFIYLFLRYFDCI